MVRDASMGGGTPSLLGAGSDSVFWSVGSGPRRVAGSSLASLPGSTEELASSAGPIAYARDHVVLLVGDTVMRAGVATPPVRLVSIVPETLSESEDATPILVWTEGAKVNWGNSDLMKSAMLTKITKCDHTRITRSSIYVAADGPSGRRLIRVDRASGEVTPLAASVTFAESFPGGAVDTATYKGRIVGADETAAFFLVEETAAGATSAGRAVLVAFPLEGEPSVVLPHVNRATGFFVTADAFYWQEGDALLSAKRSGGSASIAAQLTGPAGAVADGYVYFTHGSAIERLALD